MKENINNILEEISLACKNSNRDKEEIFLESFRRTDENALQKLKYVRLK